MLARFLGPCRLYKNLARHSLLMHRKTNPLSFVNGRQFAASRAILHSHDEDTSPGTIKVTFVDKASKETVVMAREGEIVLRLAQRHDIPMEGACEASLACTTCHCYVEPDKYFDMLPEATETEEDLLDMAPFLDVNSRLGCQILVRPELEGMVIKLPRATKNFYVDGHVPQPH